MRALCALRARSCDTSIRFWPSQKHNEVKLKARMFCVQRRKGLSDYLLVQASCQLLVEVDPQRVHHQLHVLDNHLLAGRMGAVFGNDEHGGLGGQGRRRIPVAQDDRSLGSFGGWEHPFG
eukprot:scaffold135922_cov41-Prasinocladus_malaysianus.AAC.2